ISTPLIQDLEAAGKTPSELGDEIERRLRQYMQDPVVTVIVSNFSGPFDQQIRVVGEATQPRARSEEHTSELQSRENLVCRLLLERRPPNSTLYRYTTLFRSDLDSPDSGPGGRRQDAVRTRRRDRTAAPPIYAGSGRDGDRQQLLRALRSADSRGRRGDAAAR